jgi:hypothetical protein
MIEPVPYDIIVAREDEPLVLAGPPGQLAGRVELHNRSDVDVVLRDAVLSDQNNVLTTRPLRQSLSPLVLKPYQERRLPLTLAVDPTTPPGEYRAELELAGQRRPVVLHVTEALDLTVRPQSLVVLNRPGQAQRKRIVITNEGNVAFAIGDIGDVDLEDDLLAYRPARLALEPWSESAKQDIEGPVLALIRIAREGAYVEAGASIRTAGDKLELAPGETTAVDLEITVRTELLENTRYRGRAPLLTRNLEIIVVASGDRVESSPATTPAVETGKRVESETSGRTARRRRGGRR